ncbi:hypothetical protein PENTCL1PPCAC_30847 [Pristionchus entomophagus]|uniref:Uncharacterized protein n=1 Tax=Pristionchus entomophagus TaxID=358040 RepID=A0AAV5UPS6_9BILA|nr:hypothetical protein PENTCL1PPCAC_11187 [Pristionchus entomophagus]GMT08673.1 hypothetical protein PENTCL1PPCAC_30847 [Pristionchus entomophagus]
MAGVKGDGESVSRLSRLKEDVKSAREGVEMRVSMLEEIFTSLQSCQWRDALNVSYPHPSSSTVSCTFEKSRLIVDQVCVSILVDYLDDIECILTVSTNPSSTCKWFMLDENDRPTQILTRTTTNPMRLILSFPRSILFSSDPSTTVIVHQTKLEKNQWEDERRLSDAFILNPPKDSFIVPIDISEAEELSIDSFKSISHIDQSEFDQLLYTLRLVYCSKTLPSIDVFKFMSRMENNFERNECGDNTVFVGSGLFSNILITTLKDEITYSNVLNTVFARSNEELKRVVEWATPLCAST